jgi:hypothetical protein
LVAIFSSEIIFVKQVNIAHGPQQVNNGVREVGTNPSHEEKFPTEPNKQLENVNDEWLGTGAPGEAERSEAIRRWKPINGIKISFSPEGNVQGTGRDYKLVLCN